MMLIDTHCHLNMMVKHQFDTHLTKTELTKVGTIVQQAHTQHVTTIITVGTSLIESKNCIAIAKRYPHIYATVGLHPNDCTYRWRNDLAKIKELLKKKEENKIVGIGECGLDFHWPDYNAQRQKEAFKEQIELSLEHNLALIIHTRDAFEETLHVLEEFKGQLKCGVLHCFSADQACANQLINLGLLLGIGGIITYPKNNQLRKIVTNTSLEKIVLETDAPWLPPQIARGQKNHPQYINTISHYIADLKNVSFEQIAQQTTSNARTLFQLMVPNNQ
ncbi:TatD family deoxyribonuclease [Candidatus Dependentiae bacterium]|nr:MAG: TatD family deoxyribonuclease [Candidatus Dependentiae bacterium]